MADKIQFEPIEQVDFEPLEKVEQGSDEDIAARILGVRRTFEDVAEEREAKRDLLHAEAVGEAGFGLRGIEERSTLEKAQWRGTAAINKGVADTLQQLADLSKPSLPTPRQNSMMRRILRGDRMDEMMFLGTDPLSGEVSMLGNVVAAEAAVENRKRIEAERAEMDELFKPVIQPLREREQAAREIAEAIPGKESLSKTVETVAGSAPSMLGGRYTSVAAAIAGLQQGGATKQEAKEAFLAQGMDPLEAERLADEVALASGAITATVTLGFGKIGRGGLEGTLRPVAKEAAKLGWRPVAKEVAKEALGEFPEEFTDQMFQSALAKVTYDPSMTTERAIKESFDAGVQGMVAAGVMSTPMAVAAQSRFTKSERSKELARLLDAAIMESEKGRSGIFPIRQRVQPAPPEAIQFDVEFEPTPERRMPAPTEADVAKAGRKFGIQRDDYLRTTTEELPPGVDRYFKHDVRSHHFPIEVLKPQEEVGSGSISTAHYFMRKAYEGGAEPRKPIDVRDNGDGTFDILDGHATTEVARRQGFPEVPGLIQEWRQPDGSVIKRPAMEAELERQYAEAERHEQVLRSLLDEFVAQSPVPVRAMKPRLKSFSRSEEKVSTDYAGDAKQIKDILRDTLVVETDEQAHAVAQGFQRFMGQRVVGRVRNSIGQETMDGYTDVKFNLRFGSLTAEVMVNTRSTVEAKDGPLHDLYEERSDLLRRIAILRRNATPAEKARIDQLNAEMKAGYLRARATSSAQVAASTGAPSSSARVGGNQAGVAPSQRSAEEPSKETGTSPTASSVEPAGGETGVTGSAITANIVDFEPEGKGFPPRIRKLLDSKRLAGQRARIIEAHAVSSVNADILKEGKWPNKKKLTPADRKRLKAQNKTYNEFLDNLEREEQLTSDERVATSGRPDVGRAPGVDEGARAQPPAPTVGERPAGSPPGREGQPSPAGSVQGEGGRGKRGRGTGADARQRNRATEGTSGSPAQPSADEDSGNLPREEAQPRQLAPEDRNHVIEAGDTLAPSGDKTKTRANMAAIKLLKELEAAGRNSTPEEKKVLAQYVGWGGLKQMFDHGKAERREWSQEADIQRWAKQWGALYDELKQLLTPEEYAAANRSILNAHYTSRDVISGLWKIAERLGFRGGRVLEPAAGVGHFLGLMPSELAVKSALHAVELDSVSGRITAKLYPQARVQVTGFQSARIPNNSIDLVITNVPFDADGPFDARYPRFSLHNYFFARALDTTKPGGLIVAITSTSTLDNDISVKAREYFAEKADLVGAMRLPNTAFKANAGTEVTTDILVFRKKDGAAFPLAQPFRNTRTTQTHDGRPIDINEYYAAHPEMLLGRLSLEGTMHGKDEPALLPNEGQDLGAALADAAARLPENVMGSTPAPANFASEGKAAATGTKEGQLVIDDGLPYFVEHGALVKPDWAKNKSSVARAKSYVGVRDATKSLIAAQFDPAAEDADIESKRKELNKLYDAFVKRHGPINNITNRKLLEEDPEFPLASALEDIETVNVDKPGGRVGRESRFHKAEIFAKRTMFPRLAPTRADTPGDALAISLAYKNVVDPAYVAQLLGKTEAEAKSLLIESKLVYEDPQTGVLEPPDAYLSGLVRKKLRAARAAAVDNPAYARNVTALEAVQPAPIPAEFISVGLGSNWVPGPVIQQFMSEVLEVGASVEYIPLTGTWAVKATSGWDGSRNKTTFGTERVAGHELVDDALNLKSPIVYDTVRENGADKRVRNNEQTLIAQAKQEDVKKAFAAWAKTKPDVSEQLAAIYNEQFNGTVLRQYRGPDWDYYPGASNSIKLRPHQKAGVTRCLQGCTLLAHGVGTGKTFEYATAAMEMKRLGLAKKPLIVAKNATLNQFAAEFKRLYPAAKLLVPTPRQREASQRQRLLSQIATGDYDCIIIPQSFFVRIPDDAKRERDYINARLTELQQALLAEGGGKRKSPKAADLQRAINRLTERLQKVMARKVDDVLTFEQLGIDALFIDEAHDFKKLEFSTQMDNIKGLDKGASQRGFGLMMKARFVQERNAGKNVVFGTGTPVSNTIAETWTMMRYLRPDILEEYGMEHFDGFAANFGRTMTNMEMTAGGGWKPVTRFARYKNGPELIAAFHTVADVILNEDVVLPGVPALKNGKPTTITVPPTPRVTEYQKELLRRLDEFDAMSGKEKRDNSHIPLVVFGLAKKMSLDMRLIDPSSPDEPGSKLNAAASRIKEIWERSAPNRSTQTVFADSYQSAERAARWLDVEGTIPNPAYGKAAFNLYDALRAKLVSMGIPAKEIAIVLEHDTDAKREALFKRVNDGDVRVMIGSTEKMGVGVNVQKKLLALHHLDAPPRPMDVEQRNGRIVRQGNENKEVEILTYGVAGTLDAAMFGKLAMKQKFINQVLRGDLTGRDFEDAANEQSLTFEEQMAAFSGDPLTVERVALTHQVQQLESLQASHARQLAEAGRTLSYLRENRIPFLEAGIAKDEAFAGELTRRFAGEVEVEGGVEALDAKMQAAIAALPELGSHNLPRIVVNGLEVDMDVVPGTPPYFRWKFNGTAMDPRAVTTGAGLLTSVRAAVKERASAPERRRAELAQVQKNVAELSGFVTQPFEREGELAQQRERLVAVDQELAKKQEPEREADEAAQRVAEKLSQPPPPSAPAPYAGTGINPRLGSPQAAFFNMSVLEDLVKVGRQMFRRGFTTFQNWSGAMVRRFGRLGSRIRQYLADVWQRMQNIQIAQSLGLSPDGVATVNRIEATADVANTKPALKPTYEGKTDSFLRRMGRASRRLAYFGSPELLRAKQELDLTESYQSSALRKQSDELLEQMTDAAFKARPDEWKLPRWMGLGAWANRLRRFRKLALPIAAHLNATGRDASGNFTFGDFTMRAGLMPDRQFQKGNHSVGDAIMLANPLTGEMQELTIGARIATTDGRVGYQLERAMPAALQQEVYGSFRDEYPELMWVVDTYIDPALADTRYEAHGVSLPAFNRFALAAKMAENNPGFSPIDAYTPDVLVTRSLLGAVRGALGLRRGTRSPGRKYKTGRAREGGQIRDLFSAHAIRTFQAVQEEGRREFFQAIMREARPIPGGVVPEGYIKLDTGIDEVWNAVKRLRRTRLPVDPATGDPVFPETERRLQDDDSDEFKRFIGEAGKLRGKQLMLPKPLVELLLRKYVAQREHGRLYRMGAWMVRNSVQLFLAHPKTYVANVLTNDMFAAEAAFRYATAGAFKVLLPSRRTEGQQDLRMAGNVVAGLALHRFASARELLNIANQTQFMRTVRDVLPDSVFADQTSLSDVKVRYDDKPLDLMRTGEFGAAALNAIRYGNIDVRAKQRLAYAYLKAAAVTDAKRAGLTGDAMRQAVDRFMSNPPMEARRLAVGAASFEMLNYADSPEWLNRFSQNDWGRLVLPFPRFGYHFLAKQAQRLSGLRLFLGQVPKGQRADALADVITVSLFGLGGAGLLVPAVRALFGGDDDDEDPRKFIGTSSVKTVMPDGSVKTQRLDRELVTSNRINLSYWARSLGLDTDNEQDFWIRVRQYPALVMVGATVLAENDARRYGIQHGVSTYLGAAGDLASDFFSLGMAIKVPDKALAALRSVGAGEPKESWTDPYATRVPFMAYMTEQAMDSFVPGSRQADEVLMWLDPVPKRRTESKQLDFHPGAWEALRTSHWPAVLDRMFGGLGNEPLPPAGSIETVTVEGQRGESIERTLDRLEAIGALSSGEGRMVFQQGHKPRIAFVPEAHRRPTPNMTRIASLLGFNLRPVPRASYERELSPARAPAR